MLTFLKVKLKRVDHNQEWETIQIVVKKTINKL